MHWSKPRVRRVSQILLIGGTSIGLAASALAIDNRGPWRVTNTNKVLSNVDYELWFGDKQLGYLKGTYGETVTWERAKGGHFRIIPNTASPNTRDHRKISADSFTRVALYNTKGKKYLARDRSLTRWSRVPAFEWNIRFVDPRTDGVHFAIYHADVNSYLVRRPLSAGGYLVLTCGAVTECAANACGEVCPLHQ